MSAARFVADPVASDPLHRRAQVRHGGLRRGIRIRHVIGHNESLSSPYHRERVRRLRDQTHGDMTRRSMRKYRRKLHARPCADSSGANRRPTG